jgi:site-specific recombinase XerD
MSDQLYNESHITPATTLMPALNSWKMYLTDQGRSMHTVKAFSADILLLNEFLAVDRTLGSITTEDLNQFVEWLQKGRTIPCSPKTLSRRITATKSFFNWLGKFGVLSVNPAEKVLQQSVISPLPEALTTAEVQQLYETAEKLRVSKNPDARPYCLFGLLMETGIKKGECLNIHLAHLEMDDAANGYIFVRYANPNYRMKERKIKVSAVWLEVCKEFIQQYGVKDKLFDWSQRRLEYILEDLGNAAGLRKHLSFDMCRWTSVLRDWKTETERDSIRQKLGISKIQWREISMKLKELAGKYN